MCVCVNIYTERKREIETWWWRFSVLSTKSSIFSPRSRTYNNEQSQYQKFRTNVRFHQQSHEKKENLGKKVDSSRKDQGSFCFSFKIKTSSCPKQSVKRKKENRLEGNNINVSLRHNKVKNLDTVSKIQTHMEVSSKQCFKKSTILVGIILEKKKRH